MTSRRHFEIAVGTAAVAVILALASWSSGARAQEAVSYKEDVYPIIELRCLECHEPGGSGYETSGLDLRSYDGLMKGTKYGSIVVPNSAMESTLIAVIDGRTDPEIQMPHNRKRMSKCERFLFRFWVNQGARNN